MKTNILALLLALFVGGMVNAQITVATFEDGTSSFGTISGAPIDEQAEYMAGAENPNKTGLNTSDKCLYIKSNHIFSEDVSSESPGRPNWDKNVIIIEFDEALTITDANQYLHILHLKEKVLNEWLVYGDSGDGSYVSLGRGSCPEANKWFDIVIDVKSTMSTLKKIKIHLDGNWGTNPQDRFYETAKFYYDDIEMNNNPLPKGSSITRANLLDFENMTVTNATTSVANQNAAYTHSIDYLNDETDGANGTSKCAFFKGNTLTPVWWHGFQFTFKEPVDASAYSYLHIMMRKDEAELSNVQISLVDLKGGQTNPLMNEPLTTEWKDYVFAIPATHKFISGMYVKFNAQSATTGCYADEFYLDNDPAPRVRVATAIENSTASSFSIEVRDRSVSISDKQLNSIRIYNSLGYLVAGSVASSMIYQAPSAGLYIIQINDVSQKILIK